MAEPGSKSIFNFGDGDILAAATWQNERIVFKVSSTVLANASPVRKKFIFPPFPKMPHAENESDVQLDFTEDDPDALLLLFRIAYLRFTKIPLTLDLDILLQVAVLCDQYDCVGLVYPWVEGWMAKEDETGGDDYSSNWLFIAWVFGREGAFRKAANYWVEKISLGDADGLPMIKDPTPQG
jgi:hypothetical protein